MHTLGRGRGGIVLIICVANHRESSNKRKYEPNDYDGNTDGNVGTQQSRVFLVGSHKAKQTKKEREESTIEQGEYTQKH